MNYIKNIFEWLKNFNELEVDLNSNEIFLSKNNTVIYFSNLEENSDKNKDKKYHQNKFKDYLNQNVKLITIFEDEWINKEYICKKIIKNKLGITGKKINARDCIIKELPWREAGKFYEREHISGQGSPTKINFGLFHKNESDLFENYDLIAVMSLGLKRKALGNKIKIENEYEMYRYATIDANIRGGASKLFKYFLKTYKPENVLSFCDLRWGLGKMYENIGFTFIENTDPNYYYFKLPELKRLHRFNFTKTKTVSMGGDPKLTEYENMINFGYLRIWDCGHSKWLYKNE